MIYLGVFNPGNVSVVLIVLIENDNRIIFNELI